MNGSFFPRIGGRTGEFFVGLQTVGRVTAWPHGTACGLGAPNPQCREWSYPGFLPVFARDLANRSRLPQKPCAGEGRASMCGVRRSGCGVRGPDLVVSGQWLVVRGQRDGTKQRSEIRDQRSEVRRTGRTTQRSEVRGQRGFVQISGLVQKVNGIPNRLSHPAIACQ